MNIADSERSIFHSKELQGPALNRQLESWPFHRTAFYRPFHLPNDRTHVLSSHCNARRYLRPSNKYLIGKKCIWIRQRAFTGRLILSTSFHSWLCLLKHQKFNHKLFEMIYTLSVRILNKLLAAIFDKYLLSATRFKAYLRCDKLWMYSVWAFVNLTWRLALQNLFSLGICHKGRPWPWPYIKVQAAWDYHKDLGCLDTQLLSTSSPTSW